MVKCNSFHGPKPSLTGLQDLSGGKRRRRVRAGRGSVKMGPMLDSHSDSSVSDSSLVCVGKPQDQVTYHSIFSCTTKTIRFSQNFYVLNVVPVVCDILYINGINSAAFSLQVSRSTAIPHL